MKRRLTMAAVLLCLVAPSAHAISEEDYRRPQVPRLDIDAPTSVLKGTEFAFGEWKPTSEMLTAAAGVGRRMYQDRKHVTRVLEPWRVVVDEYGEYATLLTPEAVACMIGYQAEERRWPDALVQERVVDAAKRFSSGICVYVELRSYPHESRSFWTRNQTRPGNPGEVYEASFLLDAGGPKYDGVTPKLDSAGAGEAAVNGAGLWYQKASLPVVRGKTTRLYEQMWEAFGANYYVWWSFADPTGKSAFPADSGSLTLAVVTPVRKREFSFLLQASILKVKPRALSPR